MVAKAKSEEEANTIIQYLKSKDIDSRFAGDAKFNLYSKTEAPGIGIYVHPNDVKNAARSLEGKFKNLSFDPYVTTSN